MTKKKIGPDLSPYVVCTERSNRSRIHLCVCKKQCETYDVCIDRERREGFLSEHDVNPNAEEVE